MPVIELIRSLRGRQASAAVVVSGLVIATAIGVGSAPDASAGDAAVQVNSINQFGPDSSGSDEIIGEVQNVSAANIGNVRLDFSFFDATGTLLATDYTTASVHNLAPGEKSPFEDSFTPVAGYDHYSYVVSHDTYGVVNHNFTVNVTNRYSDGSFDHLVGTVTNNNTTTASFVEVVGTGYRIDGAVVDDGTAFVNNSSNDLAAGTSATFDLIFFNGRPYDHYAILAQTSSGPSPASPSPGPSPSSSSSPTASPSSSSSPTASPSSSSSPTASPDVAPTVTLTDTVISAGQRTTVQYQGQPGATLTILSKTQPATDYSVIGSVTLDGSGFGTSSHAPTKNTRIEARTDSGLYSGQPLIQVRSVSSFNAGRTGTRTYNFTGRVYPAHAQRLVSVYRNGSLVAQARCDASGIYNVTRTLAAGSYSFQASSSNDTYNLGARSRSIPVNVH